MARVKSAMQLIEETRGTIDTRYDMRVKHVADIKEQSNGFYDLICNGFIFGYAQGMKAAKSEMKKGGGSNV